MCFLAHLAADRVLPLLDWVPEHPGVYLEVVADPTAELRSQFTKPVIYYAGRTARCGCNFAQADDEAPDANESRHMLVTYLNGALRDGESVEIYFAWVGDEALPREHDVNVSTDELATRDDVFLERQLMRVFARAAGSA